jgi:hypothetical protein
MTYLELSPAITALRSRPEEFELRDDALHHLGSRHSFRFLSDGELRIEALCGCSQLRALPQQSRALHEAFQQWRASYWQPLQINREFAGHFEPPGLFRRMLIALLRYLIAWRPAAKPAPLEQFAPLR